MNWDQVTETINRSENSYFLRQLKQVGDIDRKLVPDCLLEWFLFLQYWNESRGRRPMRFARPSSRQSPGRWCSCCCALRVRCSVPPMMDAFRPKRSPPTCRSSGHSDRKVHDFLWPTLGLTGSRRALIVRLPRPPPSASSFLLHRQTFLMSYIMANGSFKQSCVWIHWFVLNTIDFERPLERIAVILSPRDPPKGLLVPSFNRDRWPVCVGVFNSCLKSTHYSFGNFVCVCFPRKRNCYRPETHMPN